MRDSKAGTYNGELTYCPVNGWDCPYCDKNGVCHVDDPCEDCDDWLSAWTSWEEWEQADEPSDEKEDFSEEEIEWAKGHFGYEEPEYDIEMGFDPYSGCYTDDC